MGSREVSDVKLSPTISARDASEAPDAFHFWNGDEFRGEISVHKDKEKITMGGRGIYKTSDGETYEGIWEEDCLTEATKITYRDKSIFSGSLVEMMVKGEGKYLFKENVQVEGEFVDNRLRGKVYLKDPWQHLWRGEAKSDDVFLLFYPLHSFWQSVVGLPSKADLIYGELGDENEDLSDTSFN